MGTLQIYALLTRAPLFHGIGHKALIGCAVNMAGYVPPAWQTWWDSNDHLTLTDDAEAYWLQSREYIREGCLDDDALEASSRTKSSSVRPSNPPSENSSTDGDAERVSGC